MRSFRKLDRSVDSFEKEKEKNGLGSWRVMVTHQLTGELACRSKFVQMHTVFPQEHNMFSLLPGLGQLQQRTKSENSQLKELCGSTATNAHILAQCHINLCDGYGPSRTRGDLFDFEIGA